MVTLIFFMPRGVSAICLMGQRRQRDNFHPNLALDDWINVTASISPSSPELGEMEDNKAILIEVFGESSEDEQSPLKYGSPPNHCWQRIEGIEGLWLCTDYLSPQQQSSLLSAIQDERWFTEPSHNQAMRFGDLPAWAIELSASIREVVLSSNYVVDDGKGEPCPLPPDLLWREPLFDQLIVNVYHPGEGICGHVDLMRFEDGIAIVSLESSCVMHFSSVEGTISDVESDKIPVHLTPGSLVLMSGKARYEWKHEINRKPGFQKWEGQEIDQRMRTSVTLRKLRQID